MFSLSLSIGLPQLSRMKRVGRAVASGQAATALALKSLVALGLCAVALDDAAVAAPAKSASAGKPQAKPSALSPEDALRICMIGAGDRWDKDNKWAYAALNEEPLTPSTIAACKKAMTVYGDTDRSLIYTASMNAKVIQVSPIEMLEKAERLGSVAAAYVIGVGKIEGRFGYSKDRSGLEKLRFAASKEDARALYAMGAVYAGGYNNDFDPPLVKTDREMMRAYVKMAADAGYPHAQKSWAELQKQQEAERAAQAQRQRETAEYQRELARIRAERRAEERAEREAEQAETVQAIGTAIGALLGGRSGRQVSGSTGGARSCPTNHYWSSTYNRCVCTGPSANGTCYSETSNGR